MKLEPVGKIYRVIFTKGTKCYKWGLAGLSRSFLAK